MENEYYSYGNRCPGLFSHRGPFGLGHHYGNEVFWDDMNICKISLNAKRGSNPDLVIEVEGIMITIPRLDKLQRYNLGSLIYGGIAKVELPCEIERTKDNDN